MSERVVLLAVDESDHSKNAFEWYLKNAHLSRDEIIICNIPELPDLPCFTFKWYQKNVRKDGDQVIICHIPKSPKLPTFSFTAGLSLPADEWAKALEELRNSTSKLQDDYEHELRNKNIKNFKFVGEHHSKPGKGIIQAAMANNANLIVMGTRGLDAVGRTFRGSVSDDVIHNSGLPVLVVPSPSKK